ncbi:MAG: DUF1800 domain-containing protein [Rhodanobacter sp.]|nr:MAG: DUF1800 domain-containing protein [Rhodanobacter sp.]
MPNHSSSRRRSTLVPRHVLLFAPLSIVLVIAVSVAIAAPTGEPITQPANPAGPLSRDDIGWLQRIGFGIDSAQLSAYRQLGRTRYLDALLADRGHDTLPPQISALIDSYSVVDTPPEQLFADYRQQIKQYKQTPAGSAKDVAKKALQKYRRDLYLQDAQVELLRAIYGRNPLKEQMVWFWLNHFSIYAAKGPVRLFAARYEEDVIRPHALGNFRDLVMATLQSPAMLIYLDNAHNVKGKTNENYARELMELHTLGVGSGYTQQDVQELMRILTGAGILPPRMARRRERLRYRPGFVVSGTFLFNPNQHDNSTRMFLGHTISASGYAEIEQAVDLIVRQPACAQFISRQLADYFVADKPPHALVDAMTRTFERSHGDIAAVLRTMFLSKQLDASYGRKFKDPTQFLVSAMRLAYGSKPISNPTPLVNWLRQMGEPLYGRITPDGWPLESASWSGSGQMAKRFDVARAIGSGRNRLFAMPDAPTRSRPPDLHNALYRQTLAPYLSAATRTALEKARSPMEWNTFLLSSPDFNYR